MCTDDAPVYRAGPASARHSAVQRPGNKPFICFRCVGEGMQLKVAG